MTIRSVIAGVGSYLPERVVTNDEMATFVETSDEWIADRSGIRQRHYAADGQLTSDLALAAARRALEAASMTADELDLIVVGTTSPDNTLPATATKIQASLGMTRGFAFDLQAVCSGFLYALSMADSFIITGKVRTALVIGAETLSRLLDWNDRGTCVLFGDGAGAVVLKAEEGTGTSADRGILSTHLHSDGRHYHHLYVRGGVSSSDLVGKVTMDGREVFRNAVSNLSSVVEEALAANNLTIDDVDWLVPHQANKRILDSTAKKLGIPPEKVIVTVDRHANTSSASVPLALADAVATGKIRPGQLLVLEAMGGGFTWGAAVVRF